LKENPWPEPEGVTFVGENILWHKLDTKYQSWYFNKILRIYHRDNLDHISNINKSQKKKYDIQKIRNGMWNNMYILNNRKIYVKTFSQYIKCVAKYCVQKRILKSHKDKYYSGWIVKGVFTNIMCSLLYLPAILIAKSYNV